MTVRIDNPYPVWLDRLGYVLDGGEVFIGVEGGDPELSPVSVYLDAALTELAPQPLAVIGGVLCHDGNPAHFFIDQTNYSIRVRDNTDTEVAYLASANFAGEAFQPLDSDLTAIAALATTAFGRALLTQASAAATRAYLGVVDPIPATGGTTTGNIVRSGGGSHAYWVDAALTSGREFVTANGAADPTSLPGDKWFEQVP